MAKINFTENELVIIANALIDAGLGLQETLQNVDGCRAEFVSDLLNIQEDMTSALHKVNKALDMKEA